MKNIEEYKTRLYRAVKELEQHTKAEVVVLIKSQSDKYQVALLVFAAITQWITFTLLMFLPIVFGDYFFYCVTIASFFVSWMLAFFISPLQRLLIPESIMQKMVELKAMAAFHKGGISLTTGRTGILIYCSVFEQKILIVADEGIKRQIPNAAMNSMQQHFQSIFKTSKPLESLLTELAATKEILALYAPRSENDVNELPDDLEINI